MAQRGGRGDDDLGPSRRQVLRGGGAALAVTLAGTLTSCRLRLDTGDDSAPRTPTADELARDRVADEAGALLDLVTTARALRPDARGALDVLAADHRAHLAALRRPSQPDTTPSALAPPRTGSTATTGPAPTAASVLPALVAAEGAAATRTRTELAAVSPDLARLLASVAAACDLHVDLLGPTPGPAR